MSREQPEITNEYFVGGLRSRSHEVFEVVFNTYYPGLYRLTYAYLMSKNLAEDMVQDIFVSLWDSATSLPADTRLKHYLYSSVKHACLDYLKHLHVMDANKDKLTEALIFSGTVEYEDNDELLKKVQDCLLKLPERQRMVLELKVLKGLSYKEIADVMEISETSVHTHVKRAYKYLRESIPLLYILLRLWERGV